MKLLADRFARVDDDTIVDIATGRTVSWRALGALPDPPDDLRWKETCATLAGLWHEDLPSLVAYGPLDDGSRFEAFERLPAGPRTAAAAVEFLREAGVTDAPRIDLASRRPSRKRFSIGIRLLRRPALDRVTELLDQARSGRPLVVGYVAEAGGGLATFLRDVSREAVSRGFVPVSVGALRRWPALEERVGHRHVLLLAAPDEDRRGEAERILVRFALASARGHLLLRPARSGREEIRLPLDPIPPEALARAVHVHPAGALSERAIARAAERSSGRPGRFIALLAGRANNAPRPRVLRVAEARPEYRIAPVPGPSPDVTRWVERGEEAMRVAAAGRYAHGRRALAEASAALRRRREDARAARCDLALGHLLLAHGAAEQAESLFRRAHPDLDTVDDHAAVQCAAGIGAALIQRGQLESAEAVLRAARARGQDAATGLLLARCLGWQSRYEEAERVLGPALESAERAIRGEAFAVLARFALAKESLPEAGRAAGLALAAIEDAPAEAVRAAAHEVLAVVQGRIDDRPAADGHFAGAVAAARRAHLPLRAISVRLGQLETKRRFGTPAAAGIVARMERLARGGIPSLMRARIDAVLAEAHPCPEKRGTHAARCQAFVGASGATALRSAAAAQAAAAVGQDASALIALLAYESDPRRLLEGVVERLRGRLDATCVAIFDAQHRPISSSGRTAPFNATRRSLASRQPIPPYLAEQGIEAAVPIEYAGEGVGALGVRWAIDREPPSAALVLLVTGASCAGPAVQALGDRTSIEIRQVPANGIVGRSPAIAHLHDSIRRVGPCPFPVLIEGESGAGKELVAKGLHAASARRLRPFQAVNCAAFQDDLFEAELFGHARGAFTGAHAERPGLVEQADGGTLFLDEVSELTPRAQAKLLRVLQEGEIRRVGENLARRVDVRVVAASNRSLDEEVKAGRFRQDLLFRLAVIRLLVPPLRDRREDIPLLVSHLWKDAAARAGSRATVSAGALSVLARYGWPGNVRELQNVVAALAVRVPRGRVEASDVEALVSAPVEQAGRPLQEARRAFERAHVLAALARNGGHQARTARELGVTRQGLAKLLARLAIDQG